jgi:anaerobic selenocysteine-containing dehydrogenase
VSLEPDPSHPTGHAICAKGRAALELIYHAGRLLHPLRRTRPKGGPDPGWERIGWDEALDLCASRLRDIAERHGPASGVFSSVSPSTSAIADNLNLIIRNAAVDPISGSVPHRADLCQIRRAG